MPVFCLFVCLFARISQKPNVPPSLAMARSSCQLCGGVAICYVYPVVWMTVLYIYTQLAGRMAHYVYSEVATARV